MLSFQNARFDYEPYPVGLVRPVFDDATYAELVATYPSKDLFEWKPALGNKYSLSEVNNADAYRRFLAETPPWRRFHDWIKRPAFVPAVLDFLAKRNVDIGLRRYRVVSNRPIESGSSAWSRLRRRQDVSARFEFSMMGADGGHILPHTDQQHKLVTLVFSMTAPGEWDPAWGGGTEVVLPKDRSLLYNQVNRSLPFEAVDVLKTWEFDPNQCLVFVKTFNSWHSVSPMTGDATAPLRRTLTVNIEAKP